MGRVKTGKKKKNPRAWNQISLDVIRQIYFSENVLMPEKRCGAAVKVRLQQVLEKSNSLT